MKAILPEELYKFLKSKNIEHLYFATTVKNACSMLNCGELMSPHQLSFQKLPMSLIENSDTYKQSSMWNKISFYLYDLHGYFARQNKLGPVCFAIDINFLLELNEKDLYISKRNPLNWKKGLKRNQICYSSVTEFAEEFEDLLPCRTAHKNIILIRDKKSKIDLRKHLAKISLDKLENRHLLFKKAETALYNALEHSGLEKALLNVKKCDSFCFCQLNYSAMTRDEIEKLFLP